MQVDGNSTPSTGQVSPTRSVPPQRPAPAPKVRHVGQDMGVFVCLLLHYLSNESPLTRHSNTYMRHTTVMLADEQSMTHIDTPMRAGAGEATGAEHPGARPPVESRPSCGRARRRSSAGCGC